MAVNTTIELLDDDDLLDPRILNAWIRKNKKASAKNIPPMVTEHFARIKKIPPTVAGLLPVLEFIQFHLPDIENDIVHPKTLTWFREEPSNCEDFSQLMRTSIPPKSLVDELVNLQERAILDGYNSFVNPRHPTQRFPLFAPNFLQDVHNTLEAQREWKASTDWINKHSGAADTVKLL
ncbi:hypothetical protein EV360DRAFT_89796 [Lentinula raphanica]|nr:hypothetical protein EV360DRAFT_89796 [Lentinula raphanica]